jgi:hypothetical protein
MGQESLDAQNEAKEKSDAAVEIQKELSEANESLEDLQMEYKTLQSQYETLEEENNLMRAETGEGDIDNGELYETLMESTTKFTLICKPYVNENKTDSNEVEITIYSGTGGGDQEAVAVVIFTHDFSLNKLERQEKNAKMQDDLYNALKSALQENDSELILLTVQYTYGDKNFSQMDLDIIDGAKEKLERTLSKKCFIDKIKQ